MTASTKAPRPSVALAPTAPAATDPAAPVRAWLDAAALQFRGRLAVLRAIVLASICARPINVLLLGPPGTAKTALADAWCKATAARMLAVTMSPWTDIAELLGPVDLAALAKNELRRATSPTRPTATDADTIVLDELPRGAPGVRTATMPILADRRTPTWDPVKAHAIIATANTRLTSEDDQALVDRFALTIDVPRLQSDVDLEHVIGREIPVLEADGVTVTAPTSAPLPTLPVGLVESLRTASAAVVVPRDVLKAIVKLCLSLRQPPPSGAAYPDVSERRWIIATRLVQAHAVLEGRTVATWDDMTAVLPDVITNGDAASRPAIATAIGASVPTWVNAVADVERICKLAVERAYRVGEVINARPDDANGHLKVHDEFDAVLAPLAGYGADVRARAADLVERARDDVRAAWTRGDDADRARRAATKGAK